MNGKNLESFNNETTEFLQRLWKCQSSLLYDRLYDNAVDLSSMITLLSIDTDVSEEQAANALSIAAIMEQTAAVKQLSSQLERLKQTGEIK